MAPRLGLVGVGAIAILLIAALAFGVIEAPDASGRVSDAADSLGNSAYVAIPVLAFLETGTFIGLVVPLQGQEGERRDSNEPPQTVTTTRR